MHKASFTDRLRYNFDNYMSRGTIALVGGLAMITFLLILSGALILTFARVTPTGGEPLGFLDAAWKSLAHTLSSGAVEDPGWPYRILLLFIAFGGVFITSTLIGVLNNGIAGRMEQLRKGRSRVIEANHTVVLGWSEQIFSIISELVIANSNLKGSCIAILGEKDKVEMEDLIRDKVGITGGTRIVCRTGSPIALVDLELMNLDVARSIIVLAPEGDEPDSSVIKTILAITNNPRRRSEPYHIVAEIRDPRNMEVARMVGRAEVELVLVGDLISRIIAQTCRQSGLSVVYTELLDFGGDEIYFKPEPGLTGKTFAEALMAYENSAVIGLRSKTGQPHLNPAMDTIIWDGDQIIFIAEDDDTIRLSGKTELATREGAIQLRNPVPAPPERTLILGWNWRAPSIINELDTYVTPGSEVMVVANRAESEADIERLCVRKNQSAKFRAGDTTDRRTLDELGLETFQHVIVLSYSDTLAPQQADARTLITLLHLRDIANRSGHAFSIVSEMLDVRNRALAEVTHIDDFVVSDKLISLMLSQISENKELNAVFADIFDSGGSEIYLKPAANYIKPGEPVNFYTVVEAARRRNEVAIGYRIRALSGDSEQSYGVFVNPHKSREVTFTELDRIVVLAEE